MKANHREQVGRALELLREGLAPWVEAVLEASNRNPIGQRDVAALLRLMSETWNEVFRSRLTRTHRSIVEELRDWRNAWAHQEPFSCDDTERVLDSTARLLEAISASQAEAVRAMKAEVRAACAQCRVVGAQPEKPVRQRAPSRPDDTHGLRARKPRTGATDGSSLFALKLGETYYRQGFFNVRREYEAHVRQSDGPVTLVLGEGGPELGARSSRSANNNRTPRIFGGAALGQWFRGNFALGDIVRVRFDAPDRMTLGV